MIDFEITQQDFASAVRQMTKARTSDAEEQVDLTCTRESVRFVVTGRAFSCPAVVQARGMTRFPVDLLARLRTVASSFAPKPLRIRIDEGRVRVNSMSISVPNVKTKHLMDRPIDIPDDAPIRDMLALKYIFSPEEVAESDLTARFLAANAQRVKAIESSTELLAPFGVGMKKIEELVQDALRAHADTLRPMLSPKLGSDRLN